MSIAVYARRGSACDGITNDGASDNRLLTKMMTASTRHIEFCVCVCMHAFAFSRMRLSRLRERDMDAFVGCLVHLGLQTPPKSLH